MSVFRLYRPLACPVPSTPFHAKLVEFGGHAGGHMKPGEWSDPQMALTDIAIKNAKPKATQYKLHDEKGLFAIVRPTGGRLWRFKYRYQGKEQQLSLGTYPEVSLKDARQRRDEAREMLATGKGPSAEKSGRSS